MIVLGSLNLMKGWREELSTAVNFNSFQADISADTVFSDAFYTLFIVSSDCLD